MKAMAGLTTSFPFGCRYERREIQKKMENSEETIILAVFNYEELYNTKSKHYSN